MPTTRPQPPQDPASPGGSPPPVHLSFQPRLARPGSDAATAASPVLAPDQIAPPHPTLSRLAGWFGINPTAAAEPALARPLSLTLRPHQLTFLSGASGGGKTSVLRGIKDAAANRPGVCLRGPEPPPLNDAAPTLLDALAQADSENPEDRGDPASVLAALARAGLSDAWLMARPPAALSAGQRHRLDLAAMFLQAQRLAARTDAATASLPVLLLDEFGSNLDRLTATTLAMAVRRWVDRLPVAVVVATAHDDLLEALRPDVLLEPRLSGGVRVHPAGVCGRKEASL